MPNFFPKKTFKNQEKPDPKKNFFQNYDDHLNSLFIKINKAIPVNNFSELQNLASNTPSALLSQLSSEAVSRLSIFEALRDGHDYFDEVVGATAVPAIAGLACLVLAASAIWESIQELAIKIGLKNNDHEKHLEKAAANLLLAGTAFVTSIACFIKSAISLFTRPIVTAINGYKPQDVNRFTIEDSIEDDVIAFLNPSI